jgi:TonB family protein
MFRAALAVLLCAGAGAGAAEPRFTEQTIAGGMHEAGDVKWSYELYRAATLVCPKSKAGDCVRNSVHVRNESSRPIQCHVVLEQPRKDDHRRKITENDVVIYAGRGAKLTMSYGPVALVPVRFETTCVAIPATVEPYSMATECIGQAYAPPPSEFYPAGSRRRHEEGDVIFEYSVQRRSHLLHDVLVVVSSGFQDLDNAALALSKRVSVSNQCPGRRYRMKVRFLIADVA